MTISRKKRENGKPNVICEGSRREGTFKDLQKYYLVDQIIMEFIKMSNQILFNRMKIYLRRLLIGRKNKKFLRHFQTLSANFANLSIFISNGLIEN